MKKGDVVCISRSRSRIERDGSGRTGETYETWKLVRVASASRDGKVMNKYQTSPDSPVYMFRTSDGQVLQITMQQLRARRLFETRKCEYSSKEEIKNAILGA